MYTLALQALHLLIHFLLLCRSKLSSVCWNSYVKSNLICSDYEGVIQLWDVSQHTETMTFDEHAKRVWSVDFSQVCCLVSACTKTAVPFVSPKPVIHNIMLHLRNLHMLCLHRIC